MEVAKTKNSTKTFMIMGDVTRVYVPDGGNFGGNGMEGMLLGSMMNGGGGFGGGAFNNPIWALVFLAFLGNNFGGFGGNRNGVDAIQTQLNTIQGQNSLMSAITGSTSEVRSLANTLNCDVNAVQSAINGVQFAINNVANSVGMNTQGIINAVNSGNTSIITALKDCCCQTQQNITKMGYENQINNLQQSQMIQNGFCQVGYEASQNANGIKQAIADQTLAVVGKIDAQTTLINDKFCQLEMREMQNKLDAERTKNLALTNQLSQEHQSALFGQQIAQATAPIIAAQNAMAKEVNDMKCKLPNTVTVQSNEGVLIPSCVAWQAALANGGFPFNIQPQGNVFS